MKIYRGFQDRRLLPKRRSVAIGVFDGVHRGHRKILKAAIRAARRMRCSAMAVTFDPHPSHVLHPQQKAPILMSLWHRLREFEAMGVDETVVVPFNNKFSLVSAESFVEKLLVKRAGMRALCVGDDFRFGHRGLGDAKRLIALSKKLRFHLRLVRPVRSSGHVISSTRIRRLVERGRLKEAGRLLGRPVSVFGTVVRGHGRGKKIGFPTANLNPHHETLPPSGVYAARGVLGRLRLKGVIHIGQRPTFGEKEKSLEVHFFGFHADIYGRDLELIFVSRLRGIRRFAGPKALSKAILLDIRKARQVLAARA